jgi:hypothetical protein
MVDAGDREYPSLICFAVQLLCVFKFDVHFLAIECERPTLHFAVPEDSSLHHKGGE